MVELALASFDEPPQPEPVLPGDFWAARPVLEHVRTAARARGAAPDAVLAALLTHVAVRTPPSFALPALVGSRGSLNVAVALVGPSGAGKGAAMRTADDLMPPLTTRQGSGPLGTGPGMIEPFWQRKGEDHTRVRDGWLYVADEGQVLEKLAAGQGSTTLETLRAGWSGERVGAATVSAPWRVLPPGGYRMAFLLGLQPVIARPLLADVAGGTPQRFVFAGVVDPDAPIDRPADPGGISWECPEPPRHGEMPVSNDVVNEIVARRHEVLTGKRIPGPYEAHRDQCRLKVAALLGVLMQRSTITAEDWALAGMVLDCSDAVREATLAAQRDADAAVEAGRNAKAATRAAAEEAARRTVHDNVIRVARVLAKKVHRHGGEVARRDLRNAVASRDRTWFEEGVNHAEAMGWIEQTEDGRFTHGDAEPAG